jgi:hypothetical protein
MAKRRKKRRRFKIADTSRMGGPRPGSGRKPTGKARVPISTAVSPALKDAIYARAAENPDPDWSISKEIELWLNVALPEFAKQAQAKETVLA